MMRNERERVLRLAELAAELQRRKAGNLLDRVKWLPGQHAFLSSRAKRKLFRAGSQSQGKTWAGAAELIYRMLGRHPFRADIREAPIRAWVVGGGGEQSRILQEKVWELVPKDALLPGCVFDRQKGAFLGKYPRLMFKNGSIAEFKSGGQDNLNLASGTLDYVWIDEPPDSPRVYAELLKRLLKRNGDMALTLTPVNRPVEWLAEECKAGRIEDHHYRLEAAHLIPVGETEPIQLADGTVCDQEWIDSIIAETNPFELPVTVHGEWEMRVEGGYFRNVWNSDLMICDVELEGHEEFWLGIDHGDRPGKEIAVLMAIDKQHISGHPAVYVLDEYVGTTGKETPEDDARGILAMLRRNHLEWADLTLAAGDRAHLPGLGGQKSNKDLDVQIAKLLGLPRERLHPSIRTAKRGAGRGKGSVGERSRWLHHQMAREIFFVQPKCKRLLEAIPKYTGVDDDFKDPIDAIVYGCDSLVFSTWKRARQVQIRIA